MALLNVRRDAKTLPLRVTPLRVSLARPYASYQIRQQGSSSTPCHSRIWESRAPTQSAWPCTGTRRLDRIWYLIDEFDPSLEPFVLAERLLRPRLQLVRDLYHPGFNFTTRGGEYHPCSWDLVVLFAHTLDCDASYGSVDNEAVRMTQQRDFDLGG